MDLNISFPQVNDVSIFREKDTLILQSIKKTKIRSDYVHVNESKEVDPKLTEEDALAMRTDII
jgi:hypothetical protein